MPLLDLHSDSITLYERSGRRQMSALSPTKSSIQPEEHGSPPVGTTIDGTRPNAKGSLRVGPMVANALAAAVRTLSAYRPSASADVAFTRPSQNLQGVQP